jgi:hypothetical protein
MRWVIPVIALFATVPWPLAAQTAAATSRTRAYIVVKHDRQRDVTVTQLLPPSREPAAMAIGAAYECPGRTECLPVLVNVTFTAQNPRPGGAAVEAVRLVVDEQSVELASHHSLQGAARGTTESFTIMMTVENFLQMAGAEAVSYEIGGWSARLTDRQMRALDTLAQRLVKAGRPLR